jgi:hypothetical protein
VSEEDPKAISVVRVPNGYAIYVGANSAGYNINSDCRLLPIAVFESNKGLVQWMSGWAERLT